MNVEVVQSRCSKADALYGIRVEETHRGRWELTWAFPLRPEAAAREGYDRTTLKGSFGIAGGYPGCTNCGQTGIVLCGHCQKVGCAPDQPSWFKCPWCRREGEVAGHIEQLSGSGDG